MEIGKLLKIKKSAELIYSTLIYPRINLFP